MTNIPRKVIFDASALIALFSKEKGWELIKTHLATGVISSVNLSEVYKREFRIRSCKSPKKTRIT